MTMKIRPNRKVVLMASLVFFVVLGFWRCLPADPPFSLFGVLAELPMALVRSMREPASASAESAEPWWSVIGSILFIVLWPIFFALIAWLLGWISGGLVDLARKLFIRRQTPNDAPEATR
ncbi:MAG: hypothetical protein ACOYOU_03120 [Kiritimatiellia bacterium]